MLIPLFSFTISCLSKPQYTKRQTYLNENKAQFPSSIKANFPTDMVFTKDKLFFTEKVGVLKVLNKGHNNPETLKDFNVPDRVIYNELGLLGLALSPDYNKDHLVYVYQSYEKGQQLLNKVVSINTEIPEKKPIVIIEGIKGSSIHNGGKLAFGSDDKLYIATGETGQQDLSQDKKSLNGKVLRINRDGSFPKDNPFNNEVWSFGHRNIFGMTFDSTGNLYVTENGPTENDEINQITKGANYGWPITTGDKNNHFEKPLITYPLSIAPTGIIYYLGSKYKNLNNKLIFADYNNGNIHMLKIKNNKADDTVIARTEEQINAISQTQDGFIYIAAGTEIKQLLPNNNE